ncbi:hypothetical protein JCM19037_1632 [Geomicrobium sp. JCM 19037]|uniref:helix-turn-helix domain-containing protein n=1 Tax=Geomicrobium sp. JCM 19037 TaxID=1460634 RepID=UPI00045F1032|nr:helix-turn-helix domain-containing protein [Geomicrobium sp. JCM 19037]GAK03317.1 hypothetical protein JCM19037_1632 [Geomicrobium sp. JCM 19037]
MLTIEQVAAQQKPKVIDYRKEKYAIVSKRVLTNVTKFERPTDKLVYVILCMYADNDDKTSYPSNERIAELANCSARTVQRSVKLLEEIGAITVEERHDVRGYRTSNIYYLNELPADF